MQPTPVFLPGESHGQRSLVGYSPLGRRVRHKCGDLACRDVVRQGRAKIQASVCLTSWGSGKLL